jgi:hypothetical protein
MEYRTKIGWVLPGEGGTWKEQLDQACVVRLPRIFPCQTAFCLCMQLQERKLTGRAAEGWTRSMVVHLYWGWSAGGGAHGRGQWAIRTNMRCKTAQLQNLPTPDCLLSLHGAAKKGGDWQSSCGMHEEGDGAPVLGMVE